MALEKEKKPTGRGLSGRSPGESRRRRRSGGGEDEGLGPVGEFTVSLDSPDGAEDRKLRPPGEDTVALMFDDLEPEPDAVRTAASASSRESDPDVPRPPRATLQPVLPDGSDLQAPGSADDATVARGTVPLDTGQLLSVGDSLSEGERTLGAHLEMVPEEESGEVSPLRAVLMPGDFLSDNTEGMPRVKKPVPTETATQMAVPALSVHLDPPTMPLPAREPELDDDKTRKLPTAKTSPSKPADEPTAVLEKGPPKSALKSGPSSGKAKIATVEDLGLDAEDNYQQEPLLMWVASAVGLMILSAVMLAVGSMVVLLLG